MQYQNPLDPVTRTVINGTVVYGTVYTFGLGALDRISASLGIINALGGSKYGGYCSVHWVYLYPYILSICLFVAYLYYSELSCAICPEYAHNTMYEVYILCTPYSIESKIKTS